nr:hypothetical protein [Tanacetum cinerariifolium]
MFECFNDGIYWNDAIHWLNSVNGEAIHYMLEIVDEHQLLAIIETPRAFNGNVQRDCKMFESCCCLLVLCRPHTDSCNLRVYEISYASTGWSLKYRVNLDDIINPYLKTRRIPHMWCCSNVWCIVLGEREDDSFLVMELYGKVVQINIVSENACMLCDFGLPSPPHKFQYIPSFASV